jgi:hypothetical protein
MLDQDKVKAVREYLQGQFPTGTVEDRYDASSRSQVFRIHRDRTLYLAAIRQTFLDDHDAAAIPAALARFHLIEHLRDLPGQLVVVTPEGLTM